ncbi:LPS export ABC transporter periplasmic protein LptC [Marinihelvus fidelis]|nr:LPS export ABC transporter periplasmic protein LptC [Marinihelvus fidelis]
MSPRTRRGIILLGGLCLLSFWASRQDTDGEGGPIKGLDTRLDYALGNFRMLAYDEQGTPVVTLWAPRLANDAATGIGELDSPRAELHHEGFRWNIDAQHATISSDREIIQFSGNVRMVRESGEPSDHLEIESSEVMLEVTPRLASSDQWVDVADPAGKMRALGFSVDMLTNHYHLESGITGTYEIQAN